MVRPHIFSMFDCAAAAHLTCGRLLEIGPGNVWPGLKLLVRSPQLDLTGVGYSESERQQARQKANQLGVQARAQYPDAHLDPMPLEDNSVDGVFSFGGMQKWPDPFRVFDEIARVLKPGGKLFIGDAARGANWLSGWLAGWSYPELKSVYQTRAKAWDTDILQGMLEDSKLKHWKLAVHLPDLWIMGG